MDYRKTKEEEGKNKENEVNIRQQTEENWARNPKRDHEKKQTNVD